MWLCPSSCLAQSSYSRCIVLGMGLRDEIIRATGGIAQAHSRITGPVTVLAEAATDGLAADTLDLIRVLLHISGFREKVLAVLAEGPWYPRKFT